MAADAIANESFELLDAIDRRGSFAKAAEELDKATSAVSYGVQKLEAQLGITVFERRGRRSVLTPAGRLLLEEGRVILAATARAADRARELANGWEPRIRIGVEATLKQGVLFGVLQEFQRRHPDIEIEICETLLNGSWEALAGQRVELLVGAIGPIPAHRGFRTVPIGTADMVPVISSHHPQVTTVLRGQDLSEVQRVASHDTVTSEVARSAGLSLAGQQTLYVQTMEQKTLAIKAGLGVGHLPRHRIAQELADGTLLQLAVEPDTPEQYLSWELSNKGQGLRQLVQSLTRAPW